MLDLAMHLGSELRSLGLPAQLWTPSPVKAKAVDGDSAASERAMGTTSQRCPEAAGPVLAKAGGCAEWLASLLAVEGGHWEVPAQDSRGQAGPYSPFQVRRHILNAARDPGSTLQH